MSEDLQRICLDLNVPKKIMQMLIIDINDGKAIDGFKIKVYDKNEEIITQKAFIED